MNSQKTVPFIIVPKIIRYLGKNLTKEVKDLYSENHKTLMKEIKDDTHKWKDIPPHGLGEQILLECPYYLKQSIYLMKSLSKYQQHFSPN